MLELVFEIPDKNARGFLRRQREAMRLREALAQNGSVADLDNLTSFLATFVVSPTDKKQVAEMLLDLSREEYLSLLRAVNQENPDFLSSAPANGNSSRAG